MVIASPTHVVLEGEFSPLAEGRTDVDRYPRGMRYMSNMVPCRTGPGIGRSGTYFEGVCNEAAYPSKILPFEFNEDETLMLEFSHQKLRFHYEFSGIAAHRETNATAVNATNPFTITVTPHTYVIGSVLIFSGFDGRLNVNGVIANVTNVTGNVITTDLIATPVTGLVMSGNEVVARVYEVVTPYDRKDVQNLRIVQQLNFCYLFCTKTDGSGDYQINVLKRRDTFNWTINNMKLKDGPFLPINTTTTYLVPTGKGTWVQDMTSNTAPAPFSCAASSEVVNHEAWRAFDNDIDSYWEGNASQTGWLSYTFEAGFVNILPQFAAPTQAPMTISADSEAAGFPAWQASDYTNATDWQSANVLPQAWYVDMGGPYVIHEYVIHASKIHPEYAPRDFTLRGSNTGVGGPWTVVDVRAGVQWTSGQRQQFTVSSPTSFRFYSILVTAVNQIYQTTIIPHTGTKGTTDFVPRKTVTAKSANIAAFSTVQLSAGTGQLRCVDGYSIFLGRYAKGKDLKAHAPKTWYFEGFDGINWNLLDSQQDYDGWVQYRSEFFELQNSIAFKSYRLRIQTVRQEGDVNPRIGRLVMSSPDAPNLTLSATSTIGINQDVGFLNTDVGRQIRVRDADNAWRWATIISVQSPVLITVSVVSAEPFVLDKQVKFWRLGLWSDTTGWPTCGVIHEDRLFVSGAGYGLDNGFPDYLVGSITGQYSFFKQTDIFSVVTDTHAIVARCNSRFMSRIVWMKSCIEALRIGTGKQEFVLSAPADTGLNARNFRIRVTTLRGSSVHEAVSVDNDVVFLQQNGRALYTLNFTYTLGGNLYKSTLMSKLGSHLLEPPVVQIVYQQEPHSIIWGRRSDGSVVAMTYSTDDDVFGGHRHDFSGTVMDIATVYSPTDKQSSLWMVVKRHINGQDVHYIERLFRFWDYGDDLATDGTFVDCALRYYGTTATDKVYGLKQLEGQYLSVLADNIVYTNVGPVTNGMLQLVRPATTIVAGLPMLTQGEIIAPEAGAQDGTAQGKSKRPHSVVLRLWESAHGEVGRWDEDHGTLMWTPCEYNFPQDASVTDITLRTCLTNTIVLPGGYGTLGTVAFRQTEPLPFNVAGVYPQMYTEDER